MTAAFLRRWPMIVLTAAGVALLGGGAAWSVGFAMFNTAAWHTSKMPDGADAIVVLTGGADRIEAALHLLADGRAPLLLVSGVAGGVDLNDIGRRVPLDAEQAGRITLGRIAQSTAGNAAETALWARTHGVKQLIVVTAGYHMPRALLELQRALPDVQLLPAPVQSRTMRTAMRTRTLATEYDKLLAVRFGLARLFRSDETS